MIIFSALGFIIVVFVVLGLLENRSWAKEVLGAVCAGLLSFCIFVPAMITYDRWDYDEKRNELIEGDKKYWEKEAKRHREEEQKKIELNNIIRRKEYEAFIAREALEKQRELEEEKAKIESERQSNEMKFEEEKAKKELENRLLKINSRFFKLKTQTGFTFTAEIMMISSDKKSLTYRGENGEIETIFVDSLCEESKKEILNKDLNPVRLKTP